MTIEQVRQAHQARPFRAFTLTLLDGRVVRVTHPECLLFSPSGRTIAVPIEDGNIETIDLANIASLAIAEGGAQARRKKG